MLLHVSVLDLQVFLMSDAFGRQSGFTNIALESDWPEAARFFNKSSNGQPFS